MCENCANWFAPIRPQQVSCYRCDLQKDEIKKEYNNLKTYDKLLNTYNRSLQIGICETYVYFIKGLLTNLIKVGYTANNPYQRLGAIQSDSPDELKLLGVINAPYWLEQEFHLILKPLNSHHEWFEDNKGLERFIRFHSQIPKK